MFKELYYWMYIYLKRVKTNDTPATNAYFLICLLQMFNIGTLTVALLHVLKFNIPDEKNIDIFIGLGLSLVLFTINYFLLYTQKNIIFEKYDKILQDKEKRIKSQIRFWLYVILTFVIFYVAVANLVTQK